MAEIIRTGGKWLAYATGGGALLLPFVGGFQLAYLLMFASLALIALWLTSRPRIEELLEPSGLMMLAAPILIAVAFAATAREPRDLIYAGNFTMLALFPLLRAAFARFAAEQMAQRVALLSLAGSAIGGLVASWQVVVEGHVRATGIGSDPIWAAQAAVLLGALALMGTACTTGWRRYVFALGPALGAIVATLAGSRGPLVALAPLLLVAFVVARGSRGVVVLAGGLVGAVVLGSLLWASTAERIMTLPAAATELAEQEPIGEHSIEARLRFFSAAPEAFLESALVGHGWPRRLEAIYAELPGGEAALLASNPELIGNRHLHADLLDLGIGAGLFGVAAYVLALLAPLAGALGSPRDTQRRARILGTALLSTSYFACGLTYIMFGYEFPTTLFVIIAAVLIGLCRDKPAKPGAKQTREAPAT